MDHVPGELAGCDRRGLKLIIITDDGGVPLACRNHLGSGQCGHVDDNVRLCREVWQPWGERGGVRNAISEDQTALRITIVDLQLQGTVVMGEMETSMYCTR